MISFLSFVLFFSTIFPSLTRSGAVPTPNAANNNKPTVILIPAAFTKALVYDEVKARLSSVGYDVISIDLPSVGHGAGHVDRTPDIKVVQRALGMRLSQGKDVILVGTSYGATVICDVTKDFEAKSSLRVHASTRGKILGVIFFSGYIPYTTEVSGVRPDIRELSPSWFRFEGTRRVFWDNDPLVPPSVSLFNLLPKQQSDFWASKLAPSSFAALNATAEYIPYDGKFRSLYVVASEDFVVPPAFAQTYIDQPGAKMETVTIESDHMPMLSKPDAFVDVIRDFAGEKGRA